MGTIVWLNTTRLLSYDANAFAVIVDMLAIKSVKPLLTSVMYMASTPPMPPASTNGATAQVPFTDCTGSITPAYVSTYTVPTSLQSTMMAGPLQLAAPRFTSVQNVELWVYTTPAAAGHRLANTP